MCEHAVVRAHMHVLAGPPLTTRWRPARGRAQPWGPIVAEEVKWQLKLEREAEEGGQGVGLGKG